MRRAALTLVLALGACAGPNWQPATVPQARPLAERTVLEFRVRDSTVRLHAVRFDRDSLSGISWLEHTSCDSCRVRFALADINHARIGNPGAGAWNILVPFVVIVSALVAVAYLLHTTT